MFILTGTEILPLVNPKAAIYRLLIGRAIQEHAWTLQGRAYAQIIYLVFQNG